MVGWAVEWVGGRWGRWVGRWWGGGLGGWVHAWGRGEEVGGWVNEGMGGAEGRARVGHACVRYQGHLVPECV